MDALRGASAWEDHGQKIAPARLNLEPKVCQSLREAFAPGVIVASGGFFVSRIEQSLRRGGLRGSAQIVRASKPVEFVDNGAMGKAPPDSQRRKAIELREGAQDDDVLEIPQKVQAV